LNNYRVSSSKNEFLLQHEQFTFRYNRLFEVLRIQHCNGNSPSEDVYNITIGYFSNKQ